MRSLQAFAVDLRSRHFATEPLIVANVWDVASARAVADTGHPVLATSSAAVARIARAVKMPVSADMEAGYGLPSRELVDRLLEAGAAGCNLEDSDYHGPGASPRPNDKLTTSRPSPKSPGCRGGDRHQCPGGRLPPERLPA